MTPDDIAFGLNEISLTLKSWLDFNQRERDNESLPTNDDTMIMCPPVWPARGALKLWVETIDAARDRMKHDAPPTS
jgi:hypothetical protein